MNKPFVLRITVLLIIIFNCINATFAQDTVKKKAVVVKTNTLPQAVKPAPPVYPKNKYAPAPANAADSALVKDKTLNGQYQYLLTKIYRYQQPLVAALWKNVKDTLNAGRRQLNDSKAKLAEQGKTIGGLQTDVNAKDQTLSVSNAKRDEINLLGIALTKTTYNLLMWGLVIIFGAIAVIVIARSGAHSREAKYRTKLYEELDEEYRNYKTKANEKEKKLARELQTERNKLDELMGRG